MPVCCLPQVKELVCWAVSRPELKCSTSLQFPSSSMTQRLLGLRTQPKQKQLSRHKSSRDSRGNRGHKSVAASLPLALPRCRCLRRSRSSSSEARGGGSDDGIVAGEWYGHGHGHGHVRGRSEGLRPRAVPVGKGSASGKDKKSKTIYVCEDCGEDFAQWHGKCPNCSAWNTLKQLRIAKPQAGRHFPTPPGAHLPALHRSPGAGMPPAESRLGIRA